MARDSVAQAVTTRAGAEPPISYAKFRRSYVEATQPRWPAMALAKLTSLLELQIGWDSYNAPPVRHDAAMFAATILQNFMTPSTPEPSIVPSSTGGVQVEWHAKGIDLEIHVLSPYVGEVWWCDNQTGMEHAGNLSEDLSILREPLSRLSA